MPGLSFQDAREVVLREVRARLALPSVETVELNDCAGRMLAEDVVADRDYPPFDRSMRDGFAVRAADIPGRFGEVRAGEVFSGEVGPGEAVEIMTGAPVPVGADAVVMVEHCLGGSTERAAAVGDNISPRGCEAAAGSVVLERGARLNYAGIACLASVGRTSVQVFARPRVAILLTGDEIVDASDTPTGSQIRNSNAWSLAAQVDRQIKSVPPQGLFEPVTFLRREG